MHAYLGHKGQEMEREKKEKTKHVIYNFSCILDLEATFSVNFKWQPVRCRDEVIKPVFTWNRGIVRWTFPGRADVSGPVQQATLEEFENVAFFLRLRLPRTSIHHQQELLKTEKSFENTGFAF